MTTYITQKSFGDFVFGSPNNFPHVLVMMNGFVIVWAVSSEYEKTPMAGVIAQQRDGITVIPEPEEIVRVGTTSPWAFTAFDNARAPNGVFSLLYQNTPSSFQYIFVIDGEILSTPFAIDTNPENIHVGFNFRQVGRVVFSDTNFEGLALVKPGGGDFFAVVDMSFGLQAPAYAVDFDLGILYLPNYAVNRPVDPAFSLVSPPLTTGQVTTITTGTALVGLALLAALPYTRDIIVEAGKKILEAMSEIFPIAGYGAKALDIGSSFIPGG